MDGNQAESVGAVSKVGCLNSILLVVRDRIDTGAIELTQILRRNKYDNLTPLYASPVAKLNDGRCVVKPPLDFLDVPHYG